MGSKVLLLLETPINVCIFLNSKGSVSKLVTTLYLQILIYFKEMKKMIQLNIH